MLLMIFQYTIHYLIDSVHRCLHPFTPKCMLMTGLPTDHAPLLPGENLLVERLEASRDQAILPVVSVDWDGGLLPASCATALLLSSSLPLLTYS